jgi:hypothetical protein
VDFSRPRRKRFALTPAMEEAIRLGKRLGLTPSHRNLYIWELSILAESEFAGICLQEASAVIAANARQAMGFGECVNYHWFEDRCWRNPKYTFRQRDELGSPCFSGRRPINAEDLRWLEEQNKRVDKSESIARRLQELCGNDHPWAVIAEALRTKISQHSYDTWIRPLRRSYVEGSVLFVVCPTADFKYAGEKYADLISEAIDNLRLEFREARLLTGEEICAEKTAI